MVHVVLVIDWSGGGIFVVPAAVVNITPSMSSKAEAILNIFYSSFCICKKKQGICLKQSSLITCPYSFKIMLAILICY